MQFNKVLQHRTPTTASCVKSSHVLYCIVYTVRHAFFMAQTPTGSAVNNMNGCKIQCFRKVVIALRQALRPYHVVLMYFLCSMILALSTLSTRLPHLCFSTLSGQTYSTLQRYSTTSNLFTFHHVATENLKSVHVNTMRLIIVKPNTNKRGFQAVLKNKSLKSFCLFVL